MTLISLKNENSLADGVRKAEFSDGSSLFLSIYYLPGEINTVLEETPEKYAGWEFSPADEEAFFFAASCYKVEKAALRLIARAEQNSLGLTAKLGRRFSDSAAVKAVVSRFLDRNLLDDGRYAERWIRSHLSGNRSPRWLLVSLAKRGIPRGVSLDALETVLDPETEYIQLLNYLEKTGFPKHKGRISLRAQLRFEGFSPAALDRYFDALE